MCLANLAPPFGGSNVNLPKNRRVGLDLFVNWQISESIRSGLSYEYIKASFEAEAILEETMQDQEYLWCLKDFLDSFGN